MKGKSTKSALLMSFTSLLLCFAMLIGCTFAWFTDTVTSGVNKIVAGNLDVEVEYAVPAANGTLGEFQKMDNTTTSLFSSNRWEPGHTEYVTLKIKNEGTLAFKYKLNVTPVTENGGINKAGKSFKLSDYLYFGTTAATAEVQSYASRTAARDAIASQQFKPLSQAHLASMAQGGTLYPNNSATAPHEQYITLVVYMPETVGNEANYKTGTTPPEIDLGITVVATQFEHEFDSFDNQYDKFTPGEGSQPGTGAGFNPADTVVTYNYFPQTKQVAQLKQTQENTDVATKDGNDNHVKEVSSKITVESDAQVDASGNAPFAQLVFNNSDIEFTGTVGDDALKRGAVKFNAEQKQDGNFTYTYTDENNVEIEHVTYEISVDTDSCKFKTATDSDTEFATVVTVKFFVGAGKLNLTLKHGDAVMQKVNSEDVVNAADDYFYNISDGYITMKVNHFSAFVTECNAPVAAVGTEAFYSVEEAAKKAGEGTVAMIRDAKEAVEVGDIKLNLNGKTITDLTVTGAADIVDGTKSGTITKLTVDGAVKVAQVEKIEKLNVTESASVEVANDVGKVEALSVAAGATAAVPESAVVSVTASSEGAIAYTDAEPEPSGEGEEPAETVYAAKIGNLSFKSFADAMAFAKEGESTVELLKDVTNANITKSVTVTSNGFGLSATVAAGKTLTITEGTFPTFNVTGNCVVTGGTYGSDPQKYLPEYIAPGQYVEVEGTYIVKHGAYAVTRTGEDGAYIYTVSFHPVAKIGDVGYSTLYAALDAQKDGETVVLLETITGSDTTWQKLTKGNYTLDLNGHDIIGPEVDYSRPTLQINAAAGSNLTITDSTANPGSIINYRNTPPVVDQSGNHIHGALYIHGFPNYTTHVNVVIEKISIINAAGQSAITNNSASSKESLVIKSGKIQGDIYLDLSSGGDVVVSVYDAVDYTGTTKFIAATPAHKVESTDNGDYVTYKTVPDYSNCDLLLTNPATAQGAIENAWTSTSTSDFSFGMNNASTKYYNAQICRDISKTGSFTFGITSVTSVTLDLNGKSIAAGGNWTVFSATKYDQLRVLTITDSSNGDATFNNGSDGYSGIQVNNLQLVINGGNFTMSKFSLTDSTLTINGGSFTVPATYVETLKGFVTPGSTVTINEVSYTAPDSNT